MSTIDNTLSLKTEILYLDDPFVLDNVIHYNLSRARNQIPYKIHLMKKLIYNKNTNEVDEAFNEIVVDKKIDAILSKVNPICDGEIKQKQGREIVYKSHDENAELSLKNISAGLKTFIIIKTLLLNGWLEENGTIVLDEPEIHLHPEWQIIFAEIVVLLHKEFNMHILVNTHSPYFLEAIDVYADKHGVNDRCKYYLAENQGQTANIIDVTNNIEMIYKKLAKPFQTLEDERYND